MGRRLQYVMAAVVHQAAADEDDVAYGIDTPQLTDGIDQDHRIFRTCACHFFQFGTVARFIPELAVQPLDFIRPVGFAGRDDQAGFRILLTQLCKRGQYRFLFRRMGRTRHDDREGVRAQTELCFIGRQILRGNLRVGLVKFRVAGNKDLFGICPQMGNIIRVNTGLHAETADRTQHIPPDTEQVPVVLHGFFRDTAVDHHHRNVPFPDGPQEIRP